MPLLSLAFRKPDRDHSYENCRNCTRTELPLFVHTEVEVQERVVGRQRLRARGLLEVEARSRVKVQVIKVKILSRIL